jgi:hypothetical protein
MAHTEGIWQKVPLACLAAGCLALLAYKARPTRAMRLVFFCLMVIMALSGVSGVVLHVNSNLEFAKELDPDLSGVALLGESLTGATPALAPGAMILLATVGWALGQVDRRESPPASEPHV